MRASSPFGNVRDQSTADAYHRDPCNASSVAPGTSGPWRYTELWVAHRKCWDAAAIRFDPPVEKVTIPYEDTQLEGYLFRPHAQNGPVPVVTAVNAPWEEPLPDIMVQLLDDGEKEAFDEFMAAAPMGQRPLRTRRSRAAG